MLRPDEDARNGLTFGPGVADKDGYNDSFQAVPFVGALNDHVGPPPTRCRRIASC